MAGSEYCLSRILLTSLRTRADIVKRPRRSVFEQEEPMGGMWVHVWEQSRRKAELRRSFEAVCLFSALGLVLSLIFLLFTGENFDPGLMG
jgi:hypothetical protein